MIKKVYTNGKFISRRALSSHQSFEGDIAWLEARSQSITVVNNCIAFTNKDGDTVVWYYEQD